MSFGAGGFGVSLDPTKKIAKQVGWLNRKADLLEKISYSDVVHQLSMLDITEAMRILKDLEEGASQIPNPTAYVIAAAQQSGANGHYVSGPAPKYVPTSRGGGGAGVDIISKISRQVNWLNRNCQLAEPLSFEDVKGPLAALDVTSAMAILKEVEERAGELQNPNTYVIGAAARQGAIYDPNAPPEVRVVDASGMGVQLDPSGKIGRQVAWLNKNVPMTAPINFSDVVEALSKIDVTLAMSILKEIEQGASNIADPTAHVIASAEQAALEHGTVPLTPVASPDGLIVPLDPTGKIARQVRWLNSNVQLQEQLRFNEVVQPLSMLDIKDAMAILKDVEERCMTVSSPTMYVAEAAEKAVRTVATAAASGAIPAPGGGRGRASAMASMSPMSMGGLDPTGKIQRQVRWLNQKIELAEPLVFEEVVQPLSGLDISAAMSILKDVEKDGLKIRKPNAYVITACQRAAAMGRGGSMGGGGGMFGG
eukprot:CAMPEP_0176055174 /NCGR_PEP_ID=MMETSP0120_2-20121206/27461_1 /TAXON_ID=160619 /ORGANISM="Kryptoperidinium foliaceum, Strain CCMP 1326" /LENGTH=479 /DNA_ID=CAMNT_0017388655 /DNA_START=72 /DNA_END=1508 /DNA_ORIENTATION=-